MKYKSKFDIVSRMDKSKERVRLDKYLANSGVSSRRKIKNLLKEGLILVNGVKVEGAGIRIDPLRDKVSVNGIELKEHADLVYIILNKPLGVVSTTADELGRETVVDLVESDVRVYPVGRLDADSIGLVLLTSDGELTHKLTHPKFHVEKTYEVLISGRVTGGQIKKLREGVKLKDGITAPAKVKVLDESKADTKLEFKIHEGRNRQIRRMASKIGLEILELKRMGIGSIKLGKLKSGEYRNLNSEEVEDLKKLVGLDK